MLGSRDRGLMVGRWNDGVTKRPANRTATPHVEVEVDRWCLDYQRTCTSVAGYGPMIGSSYSSAIHVPISTSASPTRRAKCATETPPRWRGTDPEAA